MIQIPTFKFPLWPQICVCKERSQINQRGSGALAWHIWATQSTPRQINNGKSFPSLRCDRVSCDTNLHPDPTWLTLTRGTGWLRQSELGSWDCDPSQIPPLAISRLRQCLRPTPRPPLSWLAVSHSWPHSPPLHWEKPSRPHTLSRSLDTNLQTCK